MLAIVQPPGHAVIVEHGGLSTRIEAQEPAVTVVEVPGPQGPSPAVSVYDAATIVPTAGILTVDLQEATTFFVGLDEDVAAVQFLHVPAGRSQRVALYFIQDATGGRAITGWPAETRWPSGIEPVLSLTPNAMDLVVVDAVAGMFIGALVALDYR